MHVFGTVCYAYVQNKTKLDARAEKGIFVGYDKSSPAFLVYYPHQNTAKKIRCVKFTERLDNVESVELLLDSAKPEAEMPIHENENANVRRYPIRDRVRPKYLDDYVTGKDLDDAVDDAANCTIDFCYRITNTLQYYCSRESSGGQYTLNLSTPKILTVRENKQARPSVTVLAKKRRQNTKKIYKMKYSAEELTNLIGETPGY